MTCVCDCRNTLRFIDKLLQRYPDMELTRSKADTCIHSIKDIKQMKRTWDSWSDGSYDKFLIETFDESDLSVISLHLQECRCCRRHQCNRPQIIFDDSSSESLSNSGEGLIWEID